MDSLMHESQHKKLILKEDLLTTTIASAMTKTKTKTKTKETTKTKIKMEPT